MHAGIPPRSRHPPGTDTPREQTPPRADTPPGPNPPGKQSPAYGLRAAGTHPTGMHSCYFYIYFAVGKEREPRLLCWILADPLLLDRKVIHHKLLVMSSKQNDTFPTIGFNVTAGKQHMSLKVAGAWKSIHKHYLEDYDFFIKTDPDTYVVVENLLDFLKDKDTELPHYYGHEQKPSVRKSTYMAGGPGLVLTRESVRRLVTKAFVEYPKCSKMDGVGLYLGLSNGLIIGFSQ